MESINHNEILPLPESSIDSFKKTVRANILLALEQTEADEAQSELIDEIADMMLFKAMYLAERSDKYFKACTDIRKCFKLLGLLSDKPKAKKVKELGAIFGKKKKNVVAFAKKEQAVTISEPKANVIAEFWKKKEKQATTDELYRGLIERLGPCVQCGATNNIEPDHKEGATWNVAEYTRKQRVLRYIEDEKKGLLRALCRSCNARDGRLNRQGKARWKEKIS